MRIEQGQQVQSRVPRQGQPARQNTPSTSVSMRPQYPVSPQGPRPTLVVTPNSSHGATQKVAGTVLTRNGHVAPGQRN